MKEKRGLNKANIYNHYLGNQFSKVFNQTKKKTSKGIYGPGWFHPTTKFTKNKKEVKFDNIKTVIKCFIPEEKYGPVLKKKKLVKLGYVSDYNAEADYIIEKLGLIFEFDGPDHYNLPFKYLSDERKYDSLKSIKSDGKHVKFNIIRIPYYYSFTMDVAKYIFKTLVVHFRNAGNDNLPKDENGFYSDVKYFNTISKIFFNIFTGKPATDEKEVPGCGIHESVFAPAGYCSKGIEKILDDFSKEGDLKPPESIEHQYMWCLKLWLDDINKPLNGVKRDWLILPEWHTKFVDRYNANIRNIKKELLNHFFIREYESIERTRPNK